jgi:hypothetical protein
VVHELDIGAVSATGQRHPQRVGDEIGAHVAGELPADDPPAEGVDDEAEEHDALPAAQVGEVRQPQLSGRCALKSRLTRSGLRVAAGSAIVVRHGLPRRLAPWIAWVRIRRLTRSRPTSSPARNSAFHVRR